MSDGDEGFCPRRLLCSSVLSDVRSLHVLVSGGWPPSSAGKARRTSAGGAAGRAAASRGSVPAARCASRGARNGGGCPRAHVSQGSWCAPRSIGAAFTGLASSKLAGTHTSDRAGSPEHRLQRSCRNRGCSPATSSLTFMKVPIALCMHLSAMQRFLLRQQLPTAAVAPACCAHAARTVCVLADSLCTCHQG